MTVMEDVSKNEEIAGNGNYVFRVFKFDGFLWDRFHKCLIMFSLILVGC